MGAKTLILEDAHCAPDVLAELSLLEEVYGLDRRSKAYRLSFFSCDVTEDNLSQTSHDEFLGQCTLIKYKPKGRSVPVSYIVEAVIRPPKFAVEDSDVSNERLNNFISLEKAFRRKVLNTEFALSGVYFCQQNGLTSGCGHAALRMWLNSIGHAGDTITSDWLKRVGISPGRSFTLEQLTEAVATRGWNPLVMDCRKMHPSVYLRSMHSILASGYPAMIIFGTGSGDEHVVTAFGYTHNPDEWRSEGVNAYLGSTPIVRYSPSTQWVDHFLVHDDSVGPYYTIDTSTLMDLQVSTIIGLTPPGVSTYPAMVEMAAAEALKRLLSKETPTSIWGRRLKIYPLILRTTLRSRAEYWAHLVGLIGYDGTYLAADELTWVNTLPTRFWMTEFTLAPLFTGNRSKLGEVITSIEEIDNVPDQVLSLRLPGIVYLTRGDGLPLDIQALNLTSHAPILLSVDLTARNSGPSPVVGNLEAAQS